MLAVIAGTVSYLHMHELIAMPGQPGWVAALTLLAVASGVFLLSRSKILRITQTADERPPKSLRQPIDFTGFRQQAGI